MESSWSVIKTLIVPAVISLVIFLLLTFVVVPIWRRYRNRYGQYLPLDSISSSTSSLRDRITTRFARMMASSPLNRDRSNSSSAQIDLEDGEELDDVDEETWRAVERQAQLGRPDNSRRLSRDLEEVFRDDSDDEQDRRRAT
ncbi:hypothetical protein HJFPF1_11484 [Paramyrothecium foliicola]|nr:hypothetical protein HJFPF1_11484 [Paramyrothecium foliicola]